MGERIATFDWSKTPVGPLQDWPQSLRATVKTLLGSRYPMILLWSNSYIQIYNDAYTNLIGNKHPDALGRSIRDTQAESWETIGPMIRHVMTTGTPNWVPAQMLALTRSGYIEETYFSLSYSAVEDDNNNINGMLCVCSEVTQQVIGERRLKLQRDLSSKAGETRTLEKVCDDIMAAVSEYRSDVPFMQLYLIGSDGKLNLKSYTGIDRAEMDPVSHDASRFWSLERAANGEVVVTKKLKDIISSIGGPWDHAVDEAISIQIPSSTPGSPLGVLVAGISPNCSLDENYRSFYDLLTGQISVALRNALAHEEERKRAEALAELDRAKTTFFSNVSHEFRTPLTLMLGPLEDILAESNRSLHSKDRDQLILVYQNALRLLKLVNSLLEFSRIESNRAEASYKPTDLAMFTHELASSFESAVRKAGLEYRVNCPPLTVPINIDRSMWEKIVLNLLSNALKFTFEGFIEIAIAETPAHAVLIVRDSGVGIPAEDLQNIFKRFHRVQNSRSRSFEGTGIGLALVKELVAIHQGSIEVNSKRGGGTTFKILIPKGTAHLDPTRIESNDPPALTTTIGTASYVNEASLWTEPATAVKPVQRSKKDDRVVILVVDDNAQMVKYLSRLLEEFWEVETAKDGVDALAMIRTRRPNLVLSDVMMPNMNGFELLSAIRDDEQLQTIPVILLSARAGQEATIEGLEKGANDYLVKPFYAGELIARIKAQLDVSATRLDNVILEKRVRERTLELERTNQELEQFAYVASHDLQEPLRKIRTFASLLEDNHSKSPAKEYVRKISAASQRMSMLITNLLNFSRLTGSAPEFEDTDLEKVFDDVLKDFDLLVAEKNARIIRSALPVINAIPLQIYQLFHNLVSNALKFTDSDRQPEINIDASLMSREEIRTFPTLDPDAVHYKVEVIDNGIGFDQQYADQIFTIFKRLNPTTAYSGTGIGLALCKKIVLNHSGVLFATSKKDQGAVFTVILPKDHNAK